MSVIRSIGSRWQADLLLAVALTVAGLVEVLIAPAPDGSRLVSAIALSLATLPLAVRRAAPLVPLAALAVVWPVQAAFDGFLVGDIVTPIAPVVAIYSAGRHVSSTRTLAWAGAAVAALAVVWFALEPADGGNGALTFVYVPLPLLVGRWMRGQALLKREIEEKSEALERERERNARQAAEEERVRIAGDLQAAVTDGIAAIVRQARVLPALLASDDHARARASFASLAGGAREALADVRRILGILRHDRPEQAAPDDARVGRAETGFERDRPGGADKRAGGTGTGVARVRPAGHDDVQASGGMEVARDRPAGHDDDRPRRRREAWFDRALVALLIVGGEIELALAAPGELPLLALTPVAIMVPLLWRRQYPLLVAPAVLAGVALQSTAFGLDRFPVSDAAAVVCAAYAVAAYASQPSAGLLLMIAGSALHAAVFHPDAVVPAALGGVMLPWVAGRSIRNRRLLARALQDKTVRLELAREQEAQAAMIAERMRVARELHDAVAHNLSVIAIQAAGADGIVERDRERATQCASLIEEVGRETLHELGRLVDTAARHPGLELVDVLAERARESGLPVELRVEGERAALPAGVDLAAYRIVQEALANVSKHANAASASVVVRYEPRAVEVEVADDGRGPNGTVPASHTGGHGLVGIRERVALYDGTVAIGRRPGGGFRVHARLPVQAAGTTHAAPAPASPDGERGLA